MFRVSRLFDLGDLGVLEKSWGNIFNDYIFEISRFHWSKCTVECAIYSILILKSAQARCEKGSIFASVWFFVAIFYWNNQTGWKIVFFVMDQGNKFVSIRKDFVYLIWFILNSHEKKCENWWNHFMKKSNIRKSYIDLQ